MRDPVEHQLLRKLVLTLLALVVVVLLGTVGFWFVAGGRVSVVDALYMTVITVTTIGFGEVIDLTGNSGGRLFTIAVALSGIGVLSYFLTNFTAFIVEGELKNSFWRKKMDKQARRLKGHYIICGIGNLGANIVRELDSTGRDYLVVDNDRQCLQRLDEDLRNVVFIEGDAMDNETLDRAGVGEAKGLFAVTGDDNHNLVVALTARQLSPSIHIVAECAHAKNVDKMKRAGADAVVSPSRIGGLRMASEMLRPAVVSFLDRMMREENGNLRIEEITLPVAFVPRPLDRLDLKAYPSLLLLAVKRGDSIYYNPSKDFGLSGGDTLIVMGSPGDRKRAEEDFGG